MRCHICDRVLPEPKFNKDTDAYEPCDTCMAVILDTVGTFTDRPYVLEDELGDFQAHFTARAAEIAPENEE
jgi:hypothetical protein